MYVYVQTTIYTSFIQTFGHYYSLPEPECGLEEGDAQIQIGRMIPLLQVRLVSSWFSLLYKSIVPMLMDP